MAKCSQLLKVQSEPEKGVLVKCNKGDHYKQQNVSRFGLLSSESACEKVGEVRSIGTTSAVSARCGGSQATAAWKALELESSWIGLRSLPPNLLLLLLLERHSTQTLISTS